ncbi:MAG TPA: glycosyltransferase [Stellaceae bacterium]|nr:glycosyltransferase [Stellaceae bacterium]
MQQNFDQESQRRLRVAAFTAGADVPAARFRVRQYAEPLSRLGIDLAEYWPGLGAYPPRRRLLRPAWFAGTLAQRLPQLVAARHADIVLLQRELVSTLPTLEGLTRRPRIVDIDDSIHLHRGGLAARRLAALADLVIVGNEFLAETWRGWTPAVEILPTAVDTDRCPHTPPPDRPVIGWIGTAANLRYLQAIAPALATVLRRFPAAEIAVCCDRPPALGGLPVRFVPWSAGAEIPFLASLSIGLMPLDDGPWERGKCSMKMLQYMAAARPCVVSPVGMNREVLARGALGLAAATEVEWIDALCGLLADRDAAQRMGETGRAVAERHYSRAALAPRLAALLRRVA